MRTFLVTGGAGFIGSHIATALVERHDKVRVLDNLSTGHLSNLDAVRDKIEFIEADLLDPQAVAAAVDGVDCVFTRPQRPPFRGASRSAGHPRRVRNGHGHAPRRGAPGGSPAAGLRRFQQRYGDQPFSSKRERDLPAPISPYGAAKLAGEFYCQAFTSTYKFETVAIRYFNVFGPRQDPNSPYSAVIPLFITAMLQENSRSSMATGCSRRLHVR